MSLNRAEQLVFDYIHKEPEEGHYWREKVRALANRLAADRHSAAVALEAELWRYYEERSRVAAPFRERVRQEGLRRISMRNLAEHLLRMWVTPRPRPPVSDDKSGAG